jgi:CHAD domain-containing protein
MAYRFKLDEPFAQEFRRIGLAQIERAGRELARGRERTLAVHETRKAMKRLRALLRLMRPAIGEEVFRCENGRFRDIAHWLAGEREFDVLVETIAKLEALPQAGRHRKLLATFREEVAAARAQHTGASDGTATKEALTRLAEAKKEFARLEPHGEGFGVIGKGLARSYRKGRRTVAAAYAEPSDEAFHDVRKAVQLHWRHMALLARAWPELLEARVAAARELSQTLGEDHDLAVLVSFARGIAPDKLAPAEVEAVVDLARGRQQQLRTAARPLLARLYAEGKRDFVRRLGRYWSAARDAAREQKHPAARKPKPPTARRRGPAR